MSTVVAIQMLIEEIGSLLDNLLDSVQRGLKNNKICDEYCIRKIYYFPESPISIHKSPQVTPRDP